MENKENTIVENEEIIEESNEKVTEEEKSSTQEPKRHEVEETEISNEEVLDSFSPEPKAKKKKKQKKEKKPMTKKEKAVYWSFMSVLIIIAIVLGVLTFLPNNHIPKNNTKLNFEQGTVVVDNAKVKLPCTVKEFFEQTGFSLGRDASEDKINKESLYIYDVIREGSTLDRSNVKLYIENSSENEEIPLEEAVVYGIQTTYREDLVNAENMSETSKPSVVVFPKNIDLTDNYNAEEFTKKYKNEKIREIFPNESNEELHLISWTKDDNSHSVLEILSVDGKQIDMITYTVK